MQFVQSQINKKTREIIDEYKKEHEGCLFLHEEDFKGRSGTAYYSNSESEIISLKIHSNLYYSLKIDG